MKVHVALRNNPHQYDIEIEHRSLKISGEWARRCLSIDARRIALVSNRKVFRLYGEIVVSSLRQHEFEVETFLMPDGERYKSLKTLEKLLEFIGERQFTRGNAVVALGGGVVGDLAGFAAAIYMRGLPFLQIPTTLLAMIDSSVGGKTAVNTQFGKNLIGAFHQPAGVLIDVECLKTLPARELTAGFCEAVKQAAIADRKLFDQIADFTEKFPVPRFRKQMSDENFISALENLISSQVAFKAEIVVGDEREAIMRSDAKSRKILNFGHTLAHALEKATDYKHFKHGEAVGYGIRFAAELSKKLEITDKNTVKLLNDVLSHVGKLSGARNISLEKVFQAFAFDKKTVGKSLQWILLREIGSPVIVANEDIPDSLIRQTLKEILHE